MEMTELMGALTLIAGVGFAGGLNLYATVFALGLAGATGTVDLPGDLDVLQNWYVIGAAGLMYCIEFVADKFPGFDSVWGAVHTFIRPPVAALMGYAGTGDITGVLAGGGVAMTSHMFKEGYRAPILEPITNATASVGEDSLALGALWLVFTHPWLFLGLLVIFLLVFAILIRKIWKFWKKRKERKRAKREGRE